MSLLVQIETLAIFLRIAQSCSSTSVVGFQECLASWQVMGTQKGSPELFMSILRYKSSCLLMCRVVGVLFPVF
jgi:hypothetical protein